LAKKLRLQNANRALILNAPEGYLDLLGELPEEIKIEGELSGKYDFAHLFVKERAELEQFMDQVLQVIEYDVILWISYPKGGSGVKTDLNRDKLWKALAEKGIRPVMQVSIDEVWSAMRFRPTEQVGG
jgi:DNA-binding phage protein